MDATPAASPKRKRVASTLESAAASPALRPRTTSPVVPALRQTTLLLQRRHLSPDTGKGPSPPTAAQRLTVATWNFAGMTAAIGVMRSPKPAPPSLPSRITSRCWRGSLCRPSPSGPAGGIPAGPPPNLGSRLDSLLPARDHPHQPPHPHPGCVQRPQLSSAPQMPDLPSRHGFRANVCGSPRVSRPGKAPPPPDIRG